MATETKGVAEMLLSGLVAVQEEQAARAATPDLHRGIERWFGDIWRSREIVSSGNYTVPRGGASSEMLSFDITWREAEREQTGRFVLRYESADEPIAPRPGDSPMSGAAVEYCV